METNTVLERVLPPQFTNEIEAAIFESIEETFETKSVGKFADDLVVNAMIAGSL